MIHSKCR